jgi:hypothetical protein
MHAVERHFAIHVEYRHQELLKAAEADRQATMAQAGQGSTKASVPTRQRAPWNWPSLRVRRQATA